MLTTTSPRTSPPDPVIPSDQFKSMPLNKFCTKKFFEIGFINPSSPEEDDFIDLLLFLNKEKRHITNLTFIDKRDLGSFIDQAANEDCDLDFPPPLMQELKKFVEHLPKISSQNKEIMIEYEAYKMKFKLIQTMYQQYANSVIEKRRQNILNRELERLTEKKPMARAQMSKSDNKPGTASKAAKKQDKLEKEDYTEEALWDNDLIVDDDAKNQVSFYIFRGFNEVEVIKYLLRISVKISFVLKVSRGKVGEDSTNQFWSDYFTIRSFPRNDYLQNIVVFKYELPLQNDRNSMAEDSLNKVTNILKELIDLKRLHLKYIKNLKIINTRFNEISYAFPIYDRIMDSYPLETITIPLLLNSMLQEVQMRVDKGLRTPSLNKPTPGKATHRSHCPFDIKSILTPMRKTEKINRENSHQFFKLYEKDFLYLNFRSYKTGIQYIHDNLKILRQQVPVKLAQESIYEDDLDDFCQHKHDVMVPPENDPCFTNEQIDHLINLIYLKRKYFRYKPEEKCLENELTKNILTFDRETQVRKMMPHNLTEGTWKSVPFVDHKHGNNPYEVFKPIVFHWSEILKPEVLLQYLHWSEQEFLHCDFILCHLTNSLIVRYHNDVNSFGLHTTVWKDYLRTPVGLADFCRFTLKDDYEWLKKNKVLEQITYLEESKMYEEHSAMYKYADDANKEYRSLLVPQIQYSNSDLRKYTTCPCIEENVCKIIETCNAEGTTYPEIKANLETILKDLEEHNRVTNFALLCKEDTDKDYSFAAYNLAVSKLRIVGHTTDFVSLDKVRLTVDTSRFSNEKFKMMVRVSSQSGSMVIHTPQNRFSCHFLLFDDTIVIFSKPESNIKIEKSKDFLEESKSTLADIKFPSGDFSRKEIGKSLSSEHVLELLQRDKELTVSAMDYEHYKSLNPFPAVGDRMIESPNEAMKRNIKKDADLLRRLQRDEKCFKVTMKDPNRKKFIRSKNPERELAKSKVVKRIINNPDLSKFCEMPKRRCVIKNTDAPLANTSFDCTVTVPNGLCLKVLPSQLPLRIPVQNIKQSYNFNTAPEAVADERYRIFTHDGTVIIGKLDGCIHLLTSSGREIRFTKPRNVNDDEMFCKVKKELTEGLVRKLFTRMMSEQQGPAPSEHYISRRGHLNSKYTSIEACENFSEIEKLPFSTVTMITFEGEKIILKKKKLYKQKYSRHTTEINFRAEELYHSRDDGFTVKLDRDGGQDVEFPDKTRIKTVVYVSKEPVKVVKNDDMGWILITSTFLYEHPYYKPVFFDNINNNIEIRMNEYDCLSVNPEGGSLTMRNSTSIDVKTDFIKYTKDCSDCDLQYRSSFFIKPLYHNRVLKGEKQFFIEVEDSYRKTFKVDFEGNCKVNPDFDATPMNKMNCQHSLETDHQRVFLIKKNLEGMLLWNDKAVSDVMKYYEEDRNVNHFVDERNNLIFQTITKGFQTKHNERFYGSALKTMECTTEKSEDSNPVAYSTTRNFYSMFELDQIFGLTSCLKMFFNEEVMREAATNLRAMKYHLTNLKAPSKSIQEEVEEVDETAEVPRITLKDKVLEIRRKIGVLKKLRKKTIPNYFRSEFCTFVEEKVAGNEGKEKISEN